MLLMIDKQIQNLLRQTPEIPDLLSNVIRNAQPEEAIADSEAEDEAGKGEESEVVGLARSALVSLTRLPSLDEVHKEGKIEEQTSSGLHRNE